MRRALLLTPFAAIVLGATTFAACAEAEAGAEHEDAGAPPSDAGTALESSIPPEAEASVDAGGPSRCGPGGFCSVTVPLEGPLVAVSGSSLDDVWVLSRDTMARWRGTSWEYVYQYSGSGLPEDKFHGLWVTSSDDVWALGQGFVVRYAKQVGATPVFRKMAAEHSAGGGFWATPASDAVWITSSTSNVYRYREEPGGTLIEDSFKPENGDEAKGYYNWHSVWGFAPDDIYFGGDYCPGSCSFFPADDVLGAIAHYDGMSFSVTLLEKNESVNAMFGSVALGQPRQLWTWVGARAGFGAKENSIRLLPVADDGGVGASLFARSVTLTPIGVEGAWCDRVFGSAISPSAAWMSDGCRVYRWNGASLDLTPTAVSGIPLGKVNGIWANSGGDAWIVGEAVPQGPGSPKVGFAAQRKSSVTDEGGSP